MTNKKTSSGQSIDVFENNHVENLKRLHDGLKKNYQTATGQTTADTQRADNRENIGHLIFDVRATKQTNCDKLSTRAAIPQDLVLLRS